MTMQKKQKSVLYKEVEKMCVEEGVSMAQLARAIGTTPQNMYKRLQKGKLSYDELSNIAELMGYDFDYQFVKKAE